VIIEGDRRLKRKKRESIENTIYFSHEEKTSAHRIRIIENTNDKSRSKEDCHRKKR